MAAWCCASARRLLLLGGAIVMAGRIVVAIRKDHLRHAWRRRQKYRGGESRE
jgi:hypothetical protein